MNRDCLEEALLPLVWFICYTNICLLMLGCHLSSITTRHELGMCTWIGFLQHDASCHCMHALLYSEPLLGISTHNLIWGRASRRSWNGCPRNAHVSFWDSLENVQECRGNDDATSLGGELMLWYSEYDIVMWSTRSNASIKFPLYF